MYNYILTKRIRSHLVLPFHLYFVNKTVSFIRRKYDSLVVVRGELEIHSGFQ